MPDVCCYVVHEQQPAAPLATVCGRQHRQAVQTGSFIPVNASYALTVGHHRAWSGSAGMLLCGDRLTHRIMGCCMLTCTCMKTVYVTCMYVGCFHTWTVFIELFQSTQLKVQLTSPSPCLAPPASTAQSRGLMTTPLPQPHALPAEVSCSAQPSPAQPSQRTHLERGQLLW
jgi:hypothetical protein